MAIKRVTVSVKELKRVAKQSADYKKGYYSGFANGREKQYFADVQAAEELPDVT